MAESALALGSWARLGVYLRGRGGFPILGLHLPPPPQVASCERRGEKGRLPQGRGRAGGKTGVPAAIQRPGSAMSFGAKAGAEDRLWAVLIEALRKRRLPPRRMGRGLWEGGVRRGTGRMREPECWLGPTVQQQTLGEPGWGRSGVGDWRQRTRRLCASSCGLCVGSGLLRRHWGSSSWPFQEDPQRRPQEADAENGFDRAACCSLCSARSGSGGGPGAAGLPCSSREAGRPPAWK